MLIQQLNSFCCLKLKYSLLLAMNGTHWTESYDKGKTKEGSLYPVVWRRTASGIRIEEAQKVYFKEIIDMFKRYYIPNEILCRNVRLYDDNLSLNSYVTRLLFHLENMSSIIAIHENNNTNVERSFGKSKSKPETKIVAVLIMRIIPKIDFGRVISRVQLVEGQAMKKCVDFRFRMNRKIDLYAKYGCNKILRYYDLCILPEYRKTGLGIQMLRCGFDVARAKGVPVTVGLFTEPSLQALAKKLGLQLLLEVNYSEWRDSETELVVRDVENKNGSCALMASFVPSLPKCETPVVKKDEIVGKKAPSKNKKGKKKK